MQSIKAKEYDKVDFLKRNAELEAKIKYLQVDNENLVKERNNLDIANVELNRQKSEVDSEFAMLQGEYDYIKKSHEEMLDKFDQKIEQVGIELTKMKNENISLKEKERLYRRGQRELEEERE